MVSVDLKEQRKIAIAVLFSLGFFIYGVTGDSNLNDSTMFAKQIVKSPQRGIASAVD